MSDREAFLSRLAEIAGADGLVSDEATLTAHATDWRKRYFGVPLTVVMPSDTAQVSAIVKLCAKTGTAIVPQGGNTSLCGAATPDASGRQIVVSLARMNRIRALDPVGNTFTVEAGCTLAAAQRAASEAGRLFPLDVAPARLAQLGGNLSTNAGGVQVLRYGNARDMVLGLEVVLPSGEIWNGLRALRKDNSGYDLKHLFIGAEGTLGIITAAVLKLFPQPTAKIVALVGLDSPRAGLALLEHLRASCGERLSAFELMAAICTQLVHKHFPDLPRPFDIAYPQVALIELTDTQEVEGLRRLTEQVLQAAIERGIAREARLAVDLEQGRQFWLLRKNISDAQAADGKNIKHDISLPIARIAEFLDATDAALKQAFPGVRLVTFGHLGDGNLHYNVTHPADSEEATFMARQPEVSRIVHDNVHRFEGSISAEHGLGQYKRAEILRYKSPLEMELMRSIKRTLDPHGIMNPGKVL
ncbi:MAG TPA: FAD-binding oxidoreductase [Burkholderiales bacterium]